MKTAAGLLAHDSREAASAACAERLAGHVRDALAEQDGASLVVSGGSTPGPCLAQLSAATLDWPRITVTLSDERWVPPDHAASNERMIRDTLLSGAAAAATLLPHYRAGMTIEAGCRELDEHLQALPAPFAATLLGMGEDGHFASLFPDFAGLCAALDPASTTSSVVVDTRASNERRISLTLARLLASREILLLMFGATKRRIAESARQGDSDLPVAHLLQQAATPVTIYWAP